MYGSDAANGVIVITTKHGRAGPIHWSLDMKAGVNWLPGQWPVNYYGFRACGEPYLSNNGVDFLPQPCTKYDPSGQCTLDSVVAFQALNDPLYSPLGHGRNGSTSLTFSGGTPTTTYSLTGSASGIGGYLQLPAFEQQFYTSNYGAIPGWMVRPDHYQTSGVTGSLTIHPNASLQVGVTTSLFTSAQQRSPLDGAINKLSGVYVDTISLGNLWQESYGFNNFVQKVTAKSVTEQNTFSVKVGSRGHGCRSPGRAASVRCRGRISRISPMA